MPKISFKQEDIEKTLMVAHENVFLLRIEILFSFHFNGKKEKSAEKSSPSSGNGRANDAMSKYGAQNDNEQGGNDCGNNHYGKCDAVLPNDIEDFHT